MRKYYDFVSRIPLGYQLMLFTFFGTAINLICGMFGADYSSNEFNDGSLKHAELLLIIAPILETFFCQWLPIELIIKFVKKKDRLRNLFIAMTISSVIFALNHAFSFGYFVMTFILGFFLSTLYIQARDRKGVAIAFIFTALLHFLLNSVVVLAKLL